ncbi:uncharacterized protein [Chelonus insularis]|uniref:uncharacterized protein n=1 Tax=Chelonus insularis TaxID=460826 RepID=UPI00158CE417|nr:uncharacterized protein LOC118073068 [Chelonus insularis]
MNLIKNLLLLTIVVINIWIITGHGMVMNPVSRGSAWRKGFNTPKNYDDSGNFCGGFYTQHGRNNGMCGACGDDYAIKPPRPHENGGLYGTGTIVKTYKIGSKMDIIVKLTASHMGHFEFALCPLKHHKDIETDECFKKYPLRLVSGGIKYPVKIQKNGDIRVRVMLPPKLKCKHCVLRWHYRAGNNWGTCFDGTQGLGCGNQETFRTCSDIAIL